MSLSFEERKPVIVKFLDREGKVHVSSLAEKLEVSGETIRRDLERLEKEGVLKKVYGGAVKTKFNFRELPFDQKASLNEKEKRAICKAAAALVEDGDSIMVGHGTTPLEIARFLEGKNNITLITHSAPVFLMAKEVFDGRIIFIGGEYERSQKLTSGPLTERTLEQLKANKAFIAAGGLSTADGITDYDLHGASISRKMIERADEAIILADYTKFGKTTFAHVCSLTEASMIITDKNCPKEWRNILAEREVELFIADDV